MASPGSRSTGGRHPWPGFVLELGVRHPAVHRLLGERAQRRTSFLSTVRTRLGPPRDEVDPCWRVRPGTEAAVGAEVLEDLRERLPDWFTLANDLPTVDALLGQPRPPFDWDNTLAPAAIAIALGHLERGKAITAAVVEQIGEDRRFRAEQFARDDLFGTAVLAQARHLATRS